MHRGDLIWKISEGEGIVDEQQVAHPDDTLGRDTPSPSSPVIPYTDAKEQQVAHTVSLSPQAIPAGGIVDEQQVAHPGNAPDAKEQQVIPAGGIVDEQQVAHTGDAPDAKEQQVRDTPSPNSLAIPYTDAKEQQVTNTVGALPYEGERYRPPSGFPPTIFAEAFFNRLSNAQHSLGANIKPQSTLAVPKVGNPDKKEKSSTNNKEAPPLVLGPDGTYDVVESERRSPMVLIQTEAVLHKINTQFLVNIRYHRETRNWYEWNNSYWVLREEYKIKGKFDFYCKTIYYMVIRNDNLPELNRFRTDYYAEMVRQCELTDMFTPPSMGVVFSNGFFSEDSMTLEEHRKDEYHTHGVKFAYPKNPAVGNLPDMELFNVLGLFFADSEACCLYRTLGYRICVPRGDLQTGYILHGPNGSGKGVTVSFLQRLFPASTIKSITCGSLR